MSKEYVSEREANDEHLIAELMKDMPGYMADYKRNMDSKNRSTGTQLTYIREIKRFLLAVASANGLNSISDVTPAVLEALDWRFIETHINDIINKYADGKKNGKPAPKTRLHRLDCIRSLYNYLVKADEITQNPAAKVDTPKTSRKEVTYLTPEEIAALKSAVDKLNINNRSGFKNKALYRDRAILVTLLGTGIRVSELVGLNLSDYDTRDSCLHVVRKGGDEDIATFGATVESAINDYLALSRPLFGAPETENALFLSSQRKRLTVRSVQMLVKKYADAALISKSTHPHTMRASFATNVYKETQDIYAIKNALHHSSLETSKHYIGGEEQSKRKASDAMDSLL